MSAALAVKATAAARATVERGLNDTRLAVLGIIVAIGLAVGFGVSDPWWAAMAGGSGSVVLFGALIRWSGSRRRLMSLMHWLTGA